MVRQTVQSAVHRTRAACLRLQDKVRLIKDHRASFAATVKSQAVPTITGTLESALHQGFPPPPILPHGHYDREVSLAPAPVSRPLRTMVVTMLGMIGMLMAMPVVPTVISSTVPAAEAKQTSSRAENAIRTTGPDIIRTATGLGARLGAPVYLRALKEERKLEVWMQSKSNTWVLYKTFDVCAASGSTGPKIAQGDKQVPEGFYRIRARDLNPMSQYHLSMDIGYPNAYDRAHGRTGGDIMIHGDCVSVGCLALGVDNRQIEELYTIVSAALAAGQREVPVHVFPFRMTDAAMTKASSSPHAPFWRMIKEGWDVFETTRQIPQVDVVGRSYVFRGTHPKETLVASLDPSSGMETPRAPQKANTHPPLPARKPGMSVEDLLALLPMVETIPEPSAAPGDRITSLALADQGPTPVQDISLHATSKRDTKGDRIDTLPQLGDPAGDTFDPTSLLR